MASPPTDLTEIFDLFLREGFEAIRVTRSDGDTLEPFDSSTLFTSLIESEVPVRDSFLILDRFRAAMTTRFPGGRVTYRDIHALIGDILLEYDHPDHTLWFANYENLYYPEVSDAPAQDGMTYARHAGQLQRIVTKLLESEFGYTVGTVPRKEIDAATERVVKLIRMCGFFKLPTSFLLDFCRHLATFSSKRILPAPKRDERVYVERLREAGKWVALARVQLTATLGDRLSRGLLELSVEAIAFTCLESHGFVPKREPGAALKQLVDLLGDGRTSLSHLGRVAEMYQRLSQSLADYGLTPDRLLDVGAELSARLHPLERHDAALFTADVGRFRETVDLVEEMLNLVRLGVGADTDLGAVLAVLRSDGPPLQILQTIKEFLRSNGLASYVVQIPGDANVAGDALAGRYFLHVEMGTVYTRARDYGHSVDIILLETALSPQNLRSQIDAFAEHIAQTDGTVGLVVTRSGPERPAAERVRKTIVPVAVTHGTQLMRALASGREFFDVVQELLVEQQVAPSGAPQDEPVPSEISGLPEGYDKTDLLEAWSALVSRNALQCTQKLSLLLEDLVQMTCRVALSCSRAILGERWERESWRIQKLASTAFLKNPSLVDAVSAPPPRG